MPKFDEVAFLEKVKSGGASSKEVKEHASAVARDLRAQYQASMSAMTAVDLTGKTGSPAYQAIKQFNENFIAIAQNDILSAKTEKAQQRVFDYYTKLLEESMAIHDYQTATQLHASLTTGPIERIPHLQERIADLESILPSDPRARIKRVDELSTQYPDRIPDMATARQKISVTADNREIVARDAKTNRKGVFPRLPQLPQFNVEEPNNVQVPQTNINERVNRNSVTVTQLQERSNLIYPAPGARDENPMMGNRVKIQGETVKNEPAFFRQNVLEEFEKLKSADLKGKTPTEHLFKKAVDNIIKKMKIDPELADALREKLPQIHVQGLQAQQQAAAPVLPPESPRGVAEDANPMSAAVAEAAASAAEAAGPAPLIEPIDASSASPPLPSSQPPLPEHEHAASKVFAESSAYTGARSGGSSSPSSSTISLSSFESMMSQKKQENAMKMPQPDSPASRVGGPSPSIQSPMKSLFEPRPPSGPKPQRSAVKSSEPRPPDGPSSQASGVLKISPPVRPPEGKSPRAKDVGRDAILDQQPVFAPAQQLKSAMHKTNSPPGRHVKFADEPEQPKAGKPKNR